jgi:uncharacterized protein YpmS
LDIWKNIIYALKLFAVAAQLIKILFLLGSESETNLAKKKKHFYNATATTTGTQ